MRFATSRLLLIFLLSLTSCTSIPTATFFSSPASLTQVQNSEAELNQLVLDPPIPELGKASVSGLLYSFTGKGPIPGTLFYLTPVREIGNPPNVLVGPHSDQGDVRGVSDSEGRFILNNVPPGNYYLVVWAPYNWILAVESETDATPRLITLKPNQRLSLGIIYLSWP